MSTTTITGTNVNLPIRPASVLPDPGPGRAFDSGPWAYTTVALGVGASFTSAANSAPAGTKTIVAFFCSDQAGAASGAKIQVSTDSGTSWSDAATGTLAAGQALSISSPCIGSTPFQYRFAFTNGGVAQTRFFAGMTCYD